MGNEKSIELRDLAQSSKPLMPNTNGRACIVENGKIEFNIRHYKTEYASLNKNLEKLKNTMNIIFSNDVLEIVSKKIEDLISLTVDENLKISLNSFIPSYTSNLKTYYNTVNDMKKIYKETYSNFAQTLTNWVKTKNKIDPNEQERITQEISEKIINAQKNWTKFNEIFNLLKTICYFEIDSNKNEDKFTAINRYYDTNKEEIKKNFNFENPVQLRSVFTLKDQIELNLKEKNEFIDDLAVFYGELISLYQKVINSINSMDLSRIEIASEFNEYNGVIIYHRLIRSIEERLKQIKID